MATGWGAMVVGLVSFSCGGFDAARETADGSPPGGDDAASGDTDAAPGTPDGAPPADAAGSADAKPGPDAAPFVCPGFDVTPLGDGDSATGSVDGQPGTLLGTTCWWPADGDELVFGITVTEPIALHASVLYQGSPGTYSLAVRTDCQDIETELGCTLTGTAIPTPADLFVERLEPGNYYLVADTSYPMAGDIEVQVEFFIPEGEACDEGASDCAPATICDAGLCRATECSNGLDDDGDGFIDYTDSGCTSGDDDDESDECGPGVEIMQLTQAVTTGTLVGPSLLDQTCGPPSSGPEDVYRIDATGVILTASTAGSDIDTVLSVRRGSGSTACEADEQCADVPGSGETLSSGGPHVFIVVDSASGESGDYVLTVSGVYSSFCDADHPIFRCAAGLDCVGGLCRGPCDNAVDDDGDGLIDRYDPGCYVDGSSEVDDCPDGPGCPVCSNQLDDDGDAATDFAGDLGCSGPAGSEFCPEVDGIRLITGPIISGTTVGASDDFDGSDDANCLGGDYSPANAPDLLYAFDEPHLARYAVQILEADFAIMVGFTSGSCDVFNFCSQPDGFGLSSFITSGARNWIVVDGYLPNYPSGNFTLRVFGYYWQDAACDPAKVASGFLMCEDPQTCIDGYCR